MYSNRHTCPPKTKFTYTSNPIIFKPSPSQIPLPDIISSTVTAGFPTSYQSYQSNQYQPLRGASLPPQPIRIQQRPLSTQKRRKHKIFQQRWSPTRNTSPPSYQATAQKKSNTLFGIEEHQLEKSEAAIQCSPPPPLVKQELDKSMIEKQAQLLATKAIQSFLEQSFEEKRQLDEQKRKIQSQKQKLFFEMSRKQTQNDKLSEKIYKKVMQRMTDSDIFKKKDNFPIPTEQLSKKDKQIMYLRMENQRLMRCDKLSKENQSLYRKLVDVLKDQSFSQNNSVIQNSKHSQEPSPQKQTPVSLISQIKQQTVPLLAHGERENIIINKKSLEITTKTSPIKSPIKSPPKQPKSPLNGQEKSAERKQKHQKVQRKTHDLMASHALTFNHGGFKVHERKITPEQWIGAAKLRNQIKDNFKNIAELNELPYSTRLEQINKTLQRTIIQNNRARSSSKPHRADFDELLGRPSSRYVPKRMYMY